MFLSGSGLLLKTFYFRSGLLNPCLCLLCPSSSFAASVPSPSQVIPCYPSFLLVCWERYITTMAAGLCLDISSSTKPGAASKALAYCIWVKMLKIFLLFSGYFVGWSHLEGCGQWLDVHMKASDKWCPPGFCLETGALQHLYQ